MKIVNVVRDELKATDWALWYDVPTPRAAEVSFPEARPRLLRVPDAPQTGQENGITPLGRPPTALPVQSPRRETPNMEER